MNTITAEELQEKLQRKERVFILDVRPEAERKEWYIAESSHADVYQRLRARDVSALDGIDFPEDTTVVTVCAAGKTSQIAADLLLKKGVQALSLSGGMKSWNYAWNTAEKTLGEEVTVVQIRRPAKGVLSYLIASGNEAIVIDAALNPAVYLDLARERNWNLRYVVDTHVHADFVSRSRDLALDSGATHLLYENAGVSFPVTSIRDGEDIPFGKAALRVIHTPGHTWESATFALGDSALFTGDTLFVDGIGRPDLKATPEEISRRASALFSSLEKILALSPDALVLPAHSSKPLAFDRIIVGEKLSTVHDVVRQNLTSEASFVTYALSKVPTTPPNYQTIAALNRAGSYEGNALEDLEAGGNHCAIA